MKANEFYNKISNNYEDFINSPEINAKLNDRLIDIFDKYNIKSESILDVGCGPGNLESYLGKEFNYTGIDIADKMLILAKGRGYKTILGKIEDVLPKIESNSYDYVIAVSSLHFVKDIDFVLKEFERIAVKGFLITLDRMTDQYKQGFSSVVDDPVFDHFQVKIKDLAEDFSFDVWISPRGGEVMKVRMVFKIL